MVCACVNLLAVLRHLPSLCLALKYSTQLIKLHLILIHTSAECCSAVGPTNDEAIWDEPLLVPRAVVRDRCHVLGPVLALLWAASVAAMSDLVSEAAGGGERHYLVLGHVYPAVGIRFMESSQLPVEICHDIGIVEGFLQRVEVA